MSGTRLELVWPNKDKFLLVPKDETGKPVWVERDHPAASEVRISDFTGAYGDVNDANPYADNLLFTGDSLDVMRILNEVPEFRREYRGKVRLAYWDPPFNTEQTFAHYDDWMEHSVWLSFMRERLVLVKDLLSPDGSIWMHLDDKEVHRMRSLMDEVFGAKNFVSEVSWRAADSSNNDAQTFSNDHNTILVYSRNPGWKSNKLERSDRSNAHYKNPDDDPRGPWFPGNVSSPQPRPNLRYVIDDSFGWRGTPIGSPDNGWRWEPEAVRAKIASGEIVLSEPKPGRPRLMRKTYLSDQKGLAPSSVWGDIEETGHNRQAKYELKKLFPEVPTAELFSTPKPERLLKRVLQVATEPGDLIFDAFGGSGGTAAVAHKMGRRWITCELSPGNVASFTLPRLMAVVNGTDMGGVSVTTTTVPAVDERPGGLAPEDFSTAAKALKTALSEGALETSAEIEAALKSLRAWGKTTTIEETSWSGGGGLRTLEVGPSMYEVTGYGVLLADWATNGRFSKAVAAQLGFEWQGKTNAPFCGVRGRMRLAVLDGAVGEEEVRQIVSQLGEKERVTIVAKAVLPGAERLLAEISKGSRIRKAPRDLLGTRSRVRRARKDAV